VFAPPSVVGSLNTINSLRAKWPAKRGGSKQATHKSLCINYEQGRQINAINYRTDIAKVSRKCNLLHFPMLSFALSFV